MRHYYAKYDRSVSKSNPGYGFLNTKRVKIFRTRAQRNNFLDNRQDWDFSAGVIKRRDISAAKFRAAVEAYVRWEEDGGTIEEFSIDDPALYTTYGTSKLGI